MAVGVVDLQNVGGGQPNGTTVTPGNTGGSSGDAFSRVSANDIGTAAGNSYVFDNTDGFGYRLKQASTSQVNAYWYLPAPVSGIAISFEFMVLTLPSTSLSGFWRMFSDPIAATIAMNSTFTGSAKVYPSDARSGGNQGVSSTGVHVANQAYVYAMYYDVASMKLSLQTRQRGNPAIHASSEVVFGSAAPDIQSFRWGIAPTTAVNSGAEYRMGKMRTGHGGWLPATDIALSTISMGATKTSTGWSIVGGTDADTVLNDPDDTTGLVYQSPNGAVYEKYLGKIIKPTGDLIVAARAGRPDSTTGSLSATLWKGNTQIGPAVPASAFTTATGDSLFTFAAGDIASTPEADFNSGVLFVRLTTSAS